MADEVMVEVRDLLREVRDLLVPVADAYRDEYERREHERGLQRLEAMRAQLSTEKRRRAWELADGSRTQREIAKAAGMDEGGASRFFKAVRDLGGISDAPNPTRIVEV
jgi:hypothetical protein